ncbi:MAG: 3-dehydroquinate synthase [Acidimicrobiia bacterium]
MTGARRSVETVETVGTVELSDHAGATVRGEFGPDALGRVGERVREAAGASRVAIVSQSAIPSRYADAVGGSLDGVGVAHDLFLMGDGEEAKCLGTVEDLCRRFAQWGLLRGDAVVALGGGVVGDTAGFAAAVYHRGIALVQVPTTLLAMVDSAIGGKTGVNLPEGKNLVGAFHAPRAVVADTATLASLAGREYRSGLGEVAKYALMEGGAGPVDELVAEAEAIRARDPAVLASVVGRCARRKAAIVAADPFERTGLRATLNYGHTLAHALETAGAYDLPHGEAVAIGLVFAAELAATLGRIDTAEVERHRAVLGAFGLPTGFPGASTAAELLALMRRDKKASGGLTFVLRRAGADGVELIDDPPMNAVEHALGAVGVQG